MCGVVVAAQRATTTQAGRQRPRAGEGDAADARPPAKRAGLVWARARNAEERAAAARPGQPQERTRLLSRRALDGRLPAARTTTNCDSAILTAGEWCPTVAQRQKKARREGITSVPHASGIWPQHLGAAAQRGRLLRKRLRGSRALATEVSRQNPRVVPFFSLTAADCRPSIRSLDELQETNRFGGRSYIEGNDGVSIALPRNETI